MSRLELERSHQNIYGNTGDSNQLWEKKVFMSAKLDQFNNIKGFLHPDEGKFLYELSSEECRERFAVEIGTFTGFSAISIARGLPDGSSLLCCDVSEEWTSIARTYWERAGLDDLIDLVLAPAMQTLSSLSEDTEIDFAFIDADKGNYKNYYEAVLSRLSDHGMIVIDNVLWSGRVTHDSAIDEDTRAIKDFNSHIRNDDRVTCTILSVGDGVSLIQKK